MKKGESGGRGEERRETVVQSQHTTDAKAASRKEVGGREKMRGKKVLNLITSMDGQ